MRRLYNVEEANRTLPYVSSIVREVRERYRTIQDRGRLHNLPETAADARAQLKQEIQVEAARIQECLSELGDINLELKDYELGLVDFPAELHGRAIQLCWKFGEDTVAHWHEMSEGYFSRHPVPDDEPAWPALATLETRD